MCIALPRQALTRLPVVEAGTDGLDDPLIPQFHERLVAAGHELSNVRIARRLVAVSPGVDVVGEKDVDTRRRDALQAFLEGSQDPTSGIIVHRLKRQHLGERHPVDRIGRAGLEQAADLGRQNEAVAVVLAQDSPIGRSLSPWP